MFVLSQLCCATDSASRFQLSEPDARVAVFCCVNLNRCPLASLRVFLRMPRKSNDFRFMRLVLLSV